MFICNIYQCCGFSLVFGGLGVNGHFAVLKVALNTLTRFTQSVRVLYIVSFTINEVCVGQTEREREKG